MTILKKTVLAAACVGGLLFSGGAFAAGSTLSVSGVVPAMCEFASPNYVINFGTLDPSNTVPAVSSTNLTYRCTRGTAAQFIHIDGGPGTSPRTVTMFNGLNTMPVTLTWTTPATLGSGFGAVAPISFPVVASVGVADLNAAVAGAYGGFYGMLIMP